MLHDMPGVAEQHSTWSWLNCNQLKALCKTMKSSGILLYIMVLSASGPQAAGSPALTSTPCSAATSFAAVSLHLAYLYGHQYLSCQSKQLLLAFARVANCLYQGLLLSLSLSATLLFIRVDVALLG